MTAHVKGIDAPFPYFGGKKRIASEVWAALGWRVMAWKASGGYGGQGDGRGRENAGKERLWLSPACLDATQPTLLDALGAACS